MQETKNNVNAGDDPAALGCAITALLLLNCTCGGKSIPACIAAMPSSVIRDFYYNAGGRILTVEFLSGSIYNYMNVPEKIYLNMKNAVSKGTFLNKMVKGNYKHIKIN